MMPSVPPVMALSRTSSAARLSPDWDGEVPRALMQAGRELSSKLGYVGAVRQPPADC